MAKLPSRVILDTNLWISYLISSKLIKIDLLLEKGLIRLIFSEESLGEFIEVANRPKFRKFFSEEDIVELLSLIDQFADVVEVHSEVSVCRDPKDNFLLALAKDSFCGQSRLVKPCNPLSSRAHTGFSSRQKSTFSKKAIQMPAAESLQGPFSVL